MDTGEKDGVIRRFFDGVNPQGVILPVSVGLAAACVSLVVVALFINRRPKSY